MHCMREKSILKSKYLYHYFLGPLYTRDISHICTIFCHSHVSRWSCVPLKQPCNIKTVLLVFISHHYSLPGQSSSPLTSLLTGLSKYLLILSSFIHIKCPRLCKSTGHFSFKMLLPLYSVSFISPYISSNPLFSQQSEQL